MRADADPERAAEHFERSGTYPSAGGNPIPVDAPTLERIFRSAVRGDLLLRG